MHPPDCPEFEYQHVRGYDALLKTRIEDLLHDLRSGILLTLPLAVDSRVTHRNLFAALTPPECEYFAGHYRGAPFRCLEFYRVGVDGDNRVGMDPEQVAEAMDQLGARIGGLLSALDIQHGAGAAVSRVQRLRMAVAVAAEVFEKLLLVHPYANGNGHAARFVVWAILVRYGYFPFAWTIHPRPGHPDYTALIVAHRNGNRIPLQTALISSIINPGLRHP
jgi:fido (protein-threonine AMPylation protein)